MAKKRKKGSSNNSEKVHNNYLYQTGISELPEGYNNPSEWISLEKSARYSSKTSVTSIGVALELCRAKADLAKKELISCTENELSLHRIWFSSLVRLLHEECRERVISEADYTKMCDSSRALTNSCFGVDTDITELDKILSIVATEIVDCTQNIEYHSFMLSPRCASSGCVDFSVDFAFRVYLGYRMGVIPEAIFHKIVFWTLLEICSRLCDFNGYLFSDYICNLLRDKLPIGWVERMEKGTWVFPADIIKSCGLAKMTSFSAVSTAQRFKLIRWYAQEIASDAEVSLLIRRILSFNTANVCENLSAGTRRVYLPLVCFYAKCASIKLPKIDVRGQLDYLLSYFISRDVAMKKYNYENKDLEVYLNKLSRHKKVRGVVEKEFPKNYQFDWANERAFALLYAGVLRAKTDIFVNLTKNYVSDNCKSCSDNEEHLREISRLKKALEQKPKIVVKSQNVILDDNLKAEYDKLKTELDNSKCENEKLRSRIASLEKKQDKTMGTHISDEDLAFYHALEERVYAIDNNSEDEISYAIFTDEDKKLMQECQATFVLPSTFAFEQTKLLYPKAKFKAIKFGADKVSVAPNPDGIIFCAIHSPHGATQNLKKQLGSCSDQLYVTLAKGQLSLAKAALEHYKSLKAKR